MLKADRTAIVSVEFSLTAISPPHPEAEEEARVEQAEDAEDADQVGGDVSDFHLGFSLFDSLCREHTFGYTACKHKNALDATFFTP
jgi:hypothetical protein